MDDRDRKDELELEEPTERPPSWTSVDPRSLPECFWSSSLDDALTAASREHLTLDVAGATPLAAAFSDGEVRSFDVVVMTYRCWRGVTGVRLGGVPALLISEAQTIDEEPLDAELVGRGLALSLVPGTEASEAACVAVAESPGYRI